MHLKTIKKNWMLLIVCLGVSACSAPNTCHRWTASELEQLKAEDKALAPDSKLHVLIREYEMQCAQVGHWWNGFI